MAGRSIAGGPNPGEKSSYGSYKLLSLGDFQTDCPVCLGVLMQPGVNAERKYAVVAQSHKPCSVCRKANYSFMPDYGFEKFLEKVEVACCNGNKATSTQHEGLSDKFSGGCSWSGKLWDFKKHLNINPDTEHQLGFVEVKCIYECSGVFECRCVAAHQTQQCLKRPINCEYCQQCSSTYEFVTEIHYKECGKFPVTCPNKCSTNTFERQKLENMNVPRGGS